MEKNKECCFTCAYCSPNLICKRHSPILRRVEGDLYYIYDVKVFDTDWCGEYKPAEAKKKGK